MAGCKSCGEKLNGRIDKIYCDEHCKSAYNYQKSKNNEASFFSKVDGQLRLNRRLLKLYNRAGKSTVRSENLLNEGFNPKFFTHYWKNKKGDVYFFCFEFGFLERKENGRSKFVLVHWQSYMEN